MILAKDQPKEREVRGLVDQDRIYNTISKQDVVDTLTLDLDIKIQVDPPCGGEARSVGGAPATGRISMCHHFQYKRFNGRFLEGGSEAPEANFFLRISAKILSISKNFCQNFCRDSTPKSA